MTSKDEYIGSLLLSLFLIQGEVDRLNQTLDLARKGELVYINNPQIDKLKAENERLKQEWRLDCLKCEYKNTKADVDKYKQSLQEIKTIAEENQFYFGAGKIVSYETIKQLATSFVKILDIITKAESEG